MRRPPISTLFPSTTLFRPVHPLGLFFNHPATTEIYTLSLHDALPICARARAGGHPATRRPPPRRSARDRALRRRPRARRSEEHTSELQSLAYLVCRLLLEKN